MQLNLLGDELLVFTDAGSGADLGALSPQGRQLRVSSRPARAGAGANSGGR